jgi:hypothetical protein
MPTLKKIKELFLANAENCVKLETDNKFKIKYANTNNDQCAERKE